MEHIADQSTATPDLLAEQSFFQNPDLGDIYSRETRHDVLRFSKVDHGAVKGYAQVVLFREGPPILRALGSHGTIRHGPIMRSDCSSSDWVSFLMQIIHETRDTMTYLRIYPGRVAIPEQSAAGAGFQRTPWLDFFVDLERPERSILAGMSKDRRYGIRKGTERGVLVSTAESGEDVEQAYQLLLQTHKRARFPLEPHRFFSEIFRNFARDRFCIFIAKHRDKPLATCVVAVDGRSGVNWYAGSSSDPSASRFYPNDLVIWEAIRWSRAHGLSLFEMGGGGPPGDARGFVSFKRQFGGTTVDVGRYTFVPKAWKFELASRGFGVARMIRRLNR